MKITACGASSGRVDGNPDGWEDYETLQNVEAKEKQDEWPDEHYRCAVQELSGYLYEHTSVSASPYASAKITIKDYEGEKLETEWDAPEAFQFAGEADVIGVREQEPNTVLVNTVRYIAASFTDYGGEPRAWVGAMAKSPT